MEALISSHHAAERIDALLEHVAAEYRTLSPSRAHLPLAFREALARFALPGGLQRRGSVARSLSESLTDGRPKQC